MRFLLISLLLVATSPQAQTLKILVQSSPLAGFQYHAAGELWPELRVGDTLTLIREPDNSHDGNAIRIEWRGRMLGYLPQDRQAARASESLAARTDRSVCHPLAGHFQPLAIGFDP